MRILKYAVLAAATTGLLSSTAYAGQVTRSASALPSAKAASAPVTTVRSTKRLKKTSSVEPGTVIVGIAAVAAIGAGIYIVADEGDDPDSPG